MVLPIESDAARFERVSTIFDAAGFLHSLGIRLEKVGPDWCETSLDITDAHRQQHGYVHAGVVTTLADHTAGGAARAALAPGKDVLTLELKINFLLPGRSGRLEARGRALRAGRRIIVCEADVFGIESGERQLIAKLMSTLTVLDERPFAVVSAPPAK
jgi:uncharacterized protein (TIGR00369 family)